MKTTGFRDFVATVLLIVALALTARVAYFLGESDGRQQMPTACTGDSTNVTGIRDRGTLRLQPRRQPSTR